MAGACGSCALRIAASGAARASAVSRQCVIRTEKSVRASTATLAVTPKVEQKFRLLYGEGGDVELGAGRVGGTLHPMPCSRTVACTG